jgi:hypothetical protein
MFSGGEKNLNRLYHADNGGLCGGEGIGGLLPTNGLGGDQWRSPRCGLLARRKSVLAHNFRVVRPFAIRQRAYS